MSRFIPIRFNGSFNYVDAALSYGDFDTLNREIYWSGYVNGVVRPRVGMIVKKTHCTTGTTKWLIRAVNTTVNVNYGPASDDYRTR